MSNYIFYSFIALLSASAWALGAILWRKIGNDLSAIGMNFAKVLFGSIFLFFILLVTGFEDISTRDSLYLGISGLIGIAVGDTFFFHSLINLGPRRASLMGCLNPGLIAIFSLIFLGERPSELVWAGILITTFGVSYVLYERLPQSEKQGNVQLGLAYSLLSIICTAISVMLTKLGVESVPSIQATFIRLIWALAGLLLWGIIQRSLLSWIHPLRNKKLLIQVFSVVFIVVFGGFWLSLVALKYIDASIASVLNSTAPILILPMVIFILKEKISIRAFIGAVVAVVGISLIFINR